MSHPALTQLRALRYFDALPALDPQQLDWLLLEDSMTKRFEQQGKQVSVTLIQEGFVTSDMLDGERHLLPDDARYWLREILLCADGEPWLAGRTVVPESTDRAGTCAAEAGYHAAWALSLYIIYADTRFY
jgi:chorismate--pyruvate lyase